MSSALSFLFPTILYKRFYDDTLKGVCNIWEIVALNHQIKYGKVWNVQKVKLVYFQGCREDIIVNLMQRWVVHSIICPSACSWVIFEVTVVYLLE